MSPAQSPSAQSPAARSPDDGQSPGGGGVGPTAILGIDPGSRLTGYAALRQQGRELSVIESGVITLRGEAHPARLGDLQHQLEQILDRVAPTVAAVEDIFSHKNARSALILGQARGAALASIGRRGLEVAAYPPATVKRAVAGHGRATKEQIQRMVQVLLSLSATPRPDEADAMAVAICHAMAARLQPTPRPAPMAPQRPNKGRSLAGKKIRRW